MTGRGSTPSTRAVPRRLGGWRFSPVSRRTQGGQSEVPRRSFARSRASRGDSAVAPASRSTRGGQSEVPRRSFALSRASRGDSAVAPVSRRTRGGQSEGPRRLPALSHVGREDGAFHRSAGARGCNRARFHAVYPRCPTLAGRMALFTGQHAHAGVTGRGSTPSIRTVPHRQEGWRFSPVSRRTRV